MTGKELLLESFPTTGKIIEFLKAASAKGEGSKARVRAATDSLRLGEYCEPEQFGRNQLIARRAGAKLLRVQQLHAVAH